MSYQVTVQLDFENEPTDEDVWNRLREFADQTKIDFVVAPPFEPPFDDPVARDRREKGRVLMGVDIII